MTHRGFTNWGFGDKTNGEIVACGTGNRPHVIGTFRRFQGSPAKYEIHDYAGKQLSQIFGLTQEEAFCRAVDSAISAGLLIA